MTALTSLQLSETGGLNADGMAGFEAQIAMRTHKLSAVPPAHYLGPRVEAFERGAELARIWMGKRDVVGRVRRATRLAERRTVGLMTVFETDAATRRREQLETLAEAAADQKRADARAAAG